MNSTAVIRPLTPAIVSDIFFSVFAASSVAGLSEMWGDVLRATGAMERLDERAEIVDSTRLDSTRLDSTRPDPAQPLALPRPLSGALRSDGVSFHYPTRPNTAARHDFTLEVHPGETVALVGPSGAGKSTVFSLLLRFYDPQGESIHLDGIDLHAVPLADRGGVIALVPQETVIFSGSAADNIRFGREGASEEQVRKAARAAEAHDFISALVGGYDAEMGERGVRLSGGQRQRHRPRDPARRPATAARRSHLIARRAIQSGDPAGAGTARKRPYDMGDRPPPRHRATCQPHRRD